VNRHTTRLGWVLELAVAPTSCSQVPAILMQQAQNGRNFHCIKVAAAACTGLPLFWRVTPVLNRLLRQFVQCAEAPSKPDLRQRPIHRLSITPRWIEATAAPGQVVLVLLVPLMQRILNSDCG
jgi:hypothetical protein